MRVSMRTRLEFQQGWKEMISNLFYQMLPMNVSVLGEPVLHFWMFLEMQGLGIVKDTYLNSMK